MKRGYKIKHYKPTRWKPNFARVKCDSYIIFLKAQALLWNGKFIKYSECHSMSGTFKLIIIKKKNKKHSGQCGFGGFKFYYSS